MPNWCENKLKVQGPANEIARLKETASSGEREEEFSFDNLLAKPKEIDAAPYDPVGYNWERKNWGVKWGPIESNLQNETSELLIYSFLTAWSPPIRGILSISKNYPELTFTLYYEEPGNAFMGRSIIKNGTIDDRCLEYMDEEDRPSSEDELYTEEYKVDFEASEKLMEQQEEAMMKAISGILGDETVH